MNFIAHRDPFHVCYVLAPDGKGRSYLGCKHETPRQAIAHTVPVFVPARSEGRSSYPEGSAGTVLPGERPSEDPAAAASLPTAGDSPASDTPAGGD